MKLGIKAQWAKVPKALTHLCKFFYGILLLHYLPCSNRNVENKRESDDVFILFSAIIVKITYYFSGKKEKRTTLSNVTLFSLI